MAASPNWCRCTSCHIGYDWKGASGDFKSESAVDCLACHDGTGTYKKFPAGCGHPVYKKTAFEDKEFQAVDLGHVARNVSRTSRKTCGSCHFYGGGGDGVKHGDLDSSLLAPDKRLDVHMHAGGLDYACAVCHGAAAHDIAGRQYDRPAPGRRELALPDDTGLRISCENCHSARPHMHNDTLNRHTARVACQACHIPFLARGGISTQLSWDWSTAGRFAPGGGMIVRRDDRGNVLYHTKKGDMRWGERLVPEYAWYTGQLEYADPLARIQPGKEVLLNRPVGAYGTDGARIHPFKAHRGVQPFDAVRETVIAPKLFGDPGSGAYWADFDWYKAALTGMEEYGAPFSGSLGFVATTMYTPINHMVAPAEDALACEACHSRNGRLAGLAGFYLPGRDRSAAVDLAGWLATGLCLCGIALHGSLRYGLKHIRRRRGHAS